MKRQFGQVYNQYGFCVTKSSKQVFYPVIPKMCGYFEACTMTDRSIVVCTTAHSELENDDFVHQALPVNFRDCDLANFARFVQLQPLKNREIDFQVWFQLLGFLKSAPVLDERLEQLAKTCENGPRSVLTAWRQFGFVSKSKHILQVPAIDENAAFFCAHMMDVLITKPRDVTAALCFPEELLEYLDPEHTVISSIAHFSPNKFPETPRITFLNCESQNANIKRVCAFLVSKNYIIACYKKWVIGFAPFGWQSVEIDKSQYASLKDDILYRNYHINQCCITSANTVCYLAIAKHKWNTGVTKDDIDMSVNSAFILQSSGIKMCADLEQYFKETYTPHQIAAVEFQLPRQHANLSRFANVIQLGLAGAVEIHDFD